MKQPVIAQSVTTVLYIELARDGKLILTVYNTDQNLLLYTDFTWMFLLLKLTFRTKLLFCPRKPNQIISSCWWNALELICLAQLKTDKNKIKLSYKRMWTFALQFRHTGCTLESKWICNNTMGCCFVLDSRDSWRVYVVYGTLLALFGVVTSQGRPTIILINHLHWAYFDSSTSITFAIAFKTIRW